MVSTRGYKYKFCIGEKVLCYEPDLTKAKVLYDSKVMDVIEAKDRKGKKVVEYMIHFNGWNSSWDRRVNENFVLKDTDDNRQLQKDLADKSQLQIGAYLYRKDRKKRSRLLSNSSGSDSRHKFGSSSGGAGGGGLSEDGSSTSGIGGTNRDDYDEDMATNDGIDTESYSSSAESNNEEDRVFLLVGEKLKTLLEYDYEQITKHKRFHKLPVQLSVLTILECYVKHVSIQSILAPLQPELPRRRNSAGKIEKKEKDYNKIANSVGLRKEVGDGLRVYFDFTLKDYLLYKEEKEQGTKYVSDEFLNSYKYTPNEQQAMDILYAKAETSILSDIPEVPVSEPAENISRRRLRSYKAEENDMLLDLGKYDLNSASSTGSGGSASGSSTPQTNAITTQTLLLLKKLLPPNMAISTKIKDAVQDVLSWHMLNEYSPATPCMVYGATHLARLIIKLPEFLNASAIPDDKMKLLLQHLDTFIEYLEDHPEWFGEEFYEQLAAQKDPNESDVKDENVDGEKCKIETEMEKN